jgi:quercetin 2,3-dioxygenase
MKSNIKSIERIIPPPTVHMVGDGFLVHNFFPRYGESRMSPFFLLDYNSEYYFPPREKPRGVGAHPHRGLETVTIAYQGKIAHHDSVGNAGVIAEGDVQWMTAGSGILHNEFHEQEFSRKGGNLQMVQLWVNLRKQDKMTAPGYQGIENHQLGRYEFEKNMGLAEIISGSFYGVNGPARSFSPVDLFNISLIKGAGIDFPLPEHHNTGILIIKGNVRVNDNSVPADSFILFNNSGERIILEAEDNCKLLVMSGEPIHEPIEAHGPFLMNTREEIRQAFDDYYNGVFGVLED